MSMSNGHFFYSADPVCWKCRKYWNGEHSLNHSYDSNTIPEEKLIKDMQVCETNPKDFYTEGFGVCIKIPKIDEKFTRSFTDETIENINKSAFCKLVPPSLYPNSVVVTNTEKIKFSEEEKKNKGLFIADFTIKIFYRPIDSQETSSIDINDFSYYFYKI